MSSLLVIALLGIGLSIAQEVITWINSKLSNTILKGKGALLLSIVLAIIGATIKVAFSGVEYSWETLAETATQVWAVSQLFFAVIIQWLGVEVKHE